MVRPCGGRCKYALSDILSAALLTYVCGGDGYQDMNLSAIRKLALHGIKEHKDGLSLRKKVFKASLNKEYMRKLLADFKF